MQAFGYRSVTVKGDLTSAKSGFLQSADEDSYKTQSTEYLYFTPPLIADAL